MGQRDFVWSRIRLGLDREFGSKYVTLDVCRISICSTDILLALGQGWHILPVVQCMFLHQWFHWGMRSWHQVELVRGLFQPQLRWWCVVNRIELQVQTILGSQFLELDDNLWQRNVPFVDKVRRACLFWIWNYIHLVCSPYQAVAVWPSKCCSCGEKQLLHRLPPTRVVRRMNSSPPCSFWVHGIWIELLA